MGGEKWKEGGGGGRGEEGGRVGGWERRGGGGREEGNSCQCLCDFTYFSDVNGRNTCYPEPLQWSQ